MQYVSLNAVAVNYMYCDSEVSLAKPHVLQVKMLLL